MTGRLQIQPQPPACRDALAGLCEILRVTRPDADVERIQRAYDVAASWHQGQTRRSGNPYITHPLAVATILAETGADDEMLCIHERLEGRHVNHLLIRVLGTPRDAGRQARNWRQRLR